MIPGGLRCDARRAALGLALFLAAPAQAGLVDAVLAEVGGSIVAASDVALARGLGLFGLAPSEGTIGAADLTRYVDAWLVVLEARQLGIAPDARALDEAWEAAARPFGSGAGLANWLDRVGIGRDWARRAVAADLQWRQFVDLRFRAMAFVSERELSEALGPGSHAPETRERVRARLAREASARNLETWLEHARARVPIRWLVPEGADLESPFVLGGRDRRSPPAPPSGAEPGVPPRG